MKHRKPRLGRVQESMVLSALAGNQFLCCEDSEINLMTISRNSTVREYLWSLAYESAGCQFDGREWTERYVDNVARQL